MPLPVSSTYSPSGSLVLVVSGIVPTLTVSGCSLWSAAFLNRFSNKWRTLFSSASIMISSGRFTSSVVSSVSAVVHASSMASYMLICSRSSIVFPDRASVRRSSTMSIIRCCSSTAMSKWSVFPVLRARSVNPLAALSGFRRSCATVAANSSSLSFCSCNSIFWFWSCVTS